ncbi:MAG: tetratricopeptide repeat protein [Jatrophihabitans sp.]|uniref:tetratricopeptide repeat protein n=1 Tax=Jatrophihabitans sp. TaxID=1932789 RepID=UPI003F80F949
MSGAPAPAAWVDLYGLLEVTPDATDEQIAEAIRRQRRTWSRRAGLADPSVRGQAEERIRRLAEAERVLLDDEARQAYDDERARRAQPPAAPRPRPRPRPGPRAVLPVTPAAAASVPAGVESAAAHAARGDAHARAGDWASALGEYQAAAGARPDEVRYRAGAANALLHLGETGRALELLEAVVAARPNEPAYTELLAVALRSSAQAELSVAADGRRVITSPAQLEVVHELCTRAAMLTRDEALRAAIAADLAAAEAAARRVWWTHDVAVWAACFLVVCVTAALTSAWLWFVPAALAVVFVVVHRVPAWKAAARSDDVVQKGL